MVIEIRKMKDRKREKKVLITAVAICSTASGAVLTFFCFPMLSDGVWINVLMNAIWMMGYGTNSFIYVAMDK